MRPRTLLPFPTSFAALMTTVKFIGSSSGRAPDSFLDSFRVYVVVLPDFDLAIGGSSLEDSIRSYRLHLFDPLNPIPGPSQEGDSIVLFLYCLVASSGASPLVASGVSAMRHRGVLNITGFGLGSSLPLLSSSLSGPSPVTPLAPFVAPIPYSFPSFSAPPGFPSSSFASPLPHLSSLAPAFPLASPSVTSIASSLSPPAPPGFPMAPPTHPLAPPVGLRLPVHSLAPSITPYSFPVSFLLPSGPTALSPFLPSCAPTPAAPFLRTPVASSSSFPFVAASSVDTVVSWSLPAIVSCSAPSLSSLTASTPSLVLPVVSLGSVAPPPPSSLLASVPAFPSAPLAPLSSFLSGVPGVPSSAPGFSAGLGASASGGRCLPLPRLALFKTLLVPLVPRVPMMMRSYTLGSMTLR